MRRCRLYLSGGSFFTDSVLDIGGKSEEVSAGCSLNSGVGLHSGDRVIAFSIVSFSALLSFLILLNMIVALFSSPYSLELRHHL